jgi:hypothetical protein
MTQRKEKNPETMKLKEMCSKTIYSNLFIYRIFVWRQREGDDNSSHGNKNRQHSCYEQDLVVVSAKLRTSRVVTVRAGTTIFKAQMTGRGILTSAAEFNARLEHAGFVMHKVALRQIFSKTLGFPCGHLTRQAKHFSRLSFGAGKVDHKVRRD